MSESKKASNFFKGGRNSVPSPQPTSRTRGFASTISVTRRRSTRAGSFQNRSNASSIAVSMKPRTFVRRSVSIKSTQSSNSFASATSPAGFVVSLFKA